MQTNERKNIMALELATLIVKRIDFGDHTETAKNGWQKALGKALCNCAYKDLDHLQYLFGPCLDGVRLSKVWHPQDT